ncbi:hypothetical protein HEP85_38950 [Streptomyces sp. RPA4-2]|uniref:hypothetical protein n=1 Tax=Streptomyces sp. RPA4-2 TaxID=2721244 RepID=UPI00143E121A|nr:hypothetical protein [Streptomyces sp. RPA4-2]QIY66417.1 hypothetical protein HEP85_38950 [Streptomyces sp. RPA4-2]
MDASVVGLVGAAVGAVGAVAGGWVSGLGQGRQQQRQVQADREHRREAARREAYGACIASTKLLSNAWWRFANLVTTEQSTPEQWRAASTEVHETWTRFSTAIAAVAVAGPVAAAEAADELRVAMYEWEKAGLDWFAAALREGHGRLDQHSERFEQAWQAKRGPDRAFQRAARRALGTEEP